MVYNSIVEEPVEVVIPELKSKAGKDEISTPDKDDSKLLGGEYKLERRISKTEMSEVYLATNRKGKQVVVKKISTIRVSAELIRNEVYAGKKLRHPHIVKMIDQFETGSHCYIVLEYIRGQDLLQYMIEREWKPLKDKEAKSLFKQILQALVYSHKQGIVHHDIKLENVLLTKRGKAKLIDFGLCEPVTDCTKLSQRWCGSFDYVSPEILQKVPYSGCKADVFSLGVILYSMLFSQLPFDFKERVHEVIYRNLPHPSLKFPIRDEETKIEFNVNELAKDLLTKMLEPDPKKRICLEDIAKHPWLKKASIFSAC